MQRRGHDTQTRAIWCQGSSWREGEEPLVAADLLMKLFPDKRIRHFLPRITIVYMGPGGHRQWPVSINALLNQFSLLIYTTRQSAIAHLAEAAQACPKWRPKCYRNGTNKIADAPPPPIKFLDIATKMGSYELKGLIHDMRDKSDVLHRRSTTGIAKPGTFYVIEVLQKKLGKVYPEDSVWRDADAWVRHSTTYDFHTPEAFSFVWELPILVPTCPRKLFEQGKNMWTLLQTLCMPLWVTWSPGILLLWWDRSCRISSRRHGMEITFLARQSQRVRQSTPVGLTSTGDAAQTLLPEDQHPMHGLEFYGQEESSAQFTTYVWSRWTSKTVQPMQLNQSLQNMLHGPDRGSPTTSSAAQPNKGSGESTSP